ncbi:MAG: hypothetical protein M3083_00600 [Actinomycetota bacterium]|nr:hypothetical protein [Actinomycetota bacterium]
MLSPTEVALWDQIMAASSDRSGDVEQMLELYRQVDVRRRDAAISVPPDAGEWSEGLRQVLRRVVEGYARSIYCGPGWYRIVVELDQALAGLDPGYLVYQVKEKYGSLRYYFTTTQAESRPAMARLVGRAESLAAHTCESTGTTGAILMVRNGIYKTLDPATAPEGYEPARWQQRP